uniref:Urate oxidase N-terminal domain-containing protein n=1 Tax=Candidatus Kentrum sp. SD TaxID=2126332 RepID=A0A450YHS8_9GAMM|nr:MAG: Protein of unknown function (DUF989) [Candidatus Kentron sp. SD]VFK41071.1 MAG: Protein of unknown function (DUF989) [Candidatus Kentron sp. SD]
METYLFEVLHLMLRYFHLVAGMAWIGASFYLMWLDNNLKGPSQWNRGKDVPKDVGILDGGGLYATTKHAHANEPEKMSKSLDWFRWNVHATWLTGGALLILLYYVGADTHLLDPDKSSIGIFTALCISLGSLVLGWFIYDSLCRSSLINHGRLFVVIIIGCFAICSFLLDQFLQNRAAYIHMGALIGACMAGNVFYKILPCQRYLINELAAGRIPAPGPGIVARIYATHNHYAAFPMIFIMIGSHFPFIFDHDHGWLALIALFVIGIRIRHYFILGHRGTR